MWHLIVSVPDHCLSFYFVSCSCRSIVIHIISHCLYLEITSVSSLHTSVLDVFFLHQPGPILYKTNLNKYKYVYFTCFV